MKRDILENYILGNALMYPSFARKLIKDMPNYYFATKNKNSLYNAIKHLVNIGYDKWDLKILSDNFYKEEDAMLRAEAIALIDYSSKFNHDVLLVDLKKEHNKILLAKVLMQALDELDEKDPEQIKAEVIKGLDRFISVVTNKSKTMGDLAMSVLESSTLKKYPIDDPVFGDSVKFSKKNIYIIAGKGGSFKTKYISYVVKRLLLNYPDVSVKWANLEDPSDKMFRTFFSEQLVMTDEEIEEKIYLESQIKKELAEKLNTKMKDFDLEFTDEQMGIKDIGEAFKEFYTGREENFCLLIVDNIMSIKEVSESENEPKAIENVLKKVDGWNIKLSDRNISAVFMHHINQDTDKSEAYRPTERNIRGTSRVGDIPTVIILVNAIENYPQIAERYTIYSEYVKRLFIVEVSKNRNNKPIRKRYLAFPEYSAFVPLD